MAQDNDPTQKFLEATEKYQSLFQHLWKVVFKKLNSNIKSLTSFLTKFIAQAKDLVTTVGKAVVDKVVSIGQSIMRLIVAIPRALKDVLRFGKKIIVLIKKAIDPNQIINTLKKLFSRYVRMLREIFGYISELVTHLNVIGTALSVVNTFKLVLQAMFSWIRDITGANDAVMRAKRMLTKVIKQMKKEVKEAEKMRKEVMKLKVAA
jgi:hypothetical protein